MSDTYHLKYWNGRGLMEIPRMLIALSDIHKEDYIDGRYSTEEPIDNILSYSSISQELSHNLGRMPILSVKNEEENINDSIGQSVAINYYLATKLGFMGDNLMEQSHILELSEHLKEMKSAYNILVPYGSEPNEENLDKWFNSGSDDVSPNPATMNTRKERYMKWWCNRIEYLLGEEYAIGSRLSLGDLLIYNTFAEYLREEEAENIPQYRREPFTSLVKTNNVLTNCPKIKNICQKVAENEKIKEWLQNRGPQKF